MEEPLAQIGDDTPVLNNNIIDHMLQLPGLDKDVIVKSVVENSFDHVSAIYQLLVDKIERRNRPSCCTLANSAPVHQQLRRASITTGVVERVNDPESNNPLLMSMPTMPAMLLMQDTLQLEKFEEMEGGEGEAADERDNKSNYEDKSTYVTMRRHTVGPGDCTHEQVLEAHYMKQAAPQLNILPNTNLPQNIPLVQYQSPHNFTIKDQHLLKPPPVLGAMGGFGRRASDGGAHLQSYSQRAVSQPGSQEELKALQPGSPALAQRSQPISGCAPDAGQMQCSPDLGDANMEEMSPDVYAVARYMQGRGSMQRHTLGTSEEAQRKQPQGQSSSQQRTRRSGLLTVMERPPVISPELVQEVESRMNRQHTPPLLPVVAAPSTRPRLRKPQISALPTVQESHRVSGPLKVISRNIVEHYESCDVGGREGLKDVTTLHLPGERYSPVRRASVGSTSHYTADTSLRELQIEHQQLTQQQVPRYDPAEMQLRHCLDMQQMRNTPLGSPSPSPPHQPFSGGVSPLTPADKYEGVPKSNRNCIAGSQQRVVHIPAARRVSRNPLRAQ
ncbi:hypothetical protein J6590_021226 [Homalodisca vitripennis]|nr:hypothetical protein J6590_021226 [Homalodisca vitripennis]